MPRPLVSELTSPPRRIVDAHHHLWDMAPGTHPWLDAPVDPSSPLGDYSALRRPYLVEDYAADTEGLNVVAAVHVEAAWDPADPVAETAWLRGHQSSSLPRPIVAGARLEADDVSSTLARHGEHTGVVGVRQMLDRGAGRELLDDDRWQAGLSQLARRNLVFDLQITPDQADAAAILAARAPDLTFALNHAGWPADRTPDGVAEWRSGVERLARHDNVCVKLSGFGMFDHAWTPESIKPIVSFTLDRFGPGRCMFGSNFPVDRLYASFNEVVAGLASTLTGLTTNERDAVFFGTAARTYALGSAGT